MILLKHPFFLSFFFLLLLVEGHGASCYGRHQFAFGPEFYHLKRIRKGGTEQTGYLYGVRLNYDHIGRYLIYWGLEAAYAKGTLRGETGRDDDLKSRFSDQNIEARVGYTFQSESGCCASFTPFTGVGYFIEKNEYVHPSPATYHFRNTFYYALLGALTKAYLNTKCTIGLNVAAMFSMDGKVKVSHDSDKGNNTLRYENKILCRATLPICYSGEICGCPGEFCLKPFYEYRQYGRHHNIPYDFPDTKIKIFGAALEYCLYF